MPKIRRFDREARAFGVARRSYDMDEIYEFVEGTAAEMARIDLRSLAEAIRRGPEAVERYIDRNAGRVLQTAWPPGSEIVVAPLSTDPDFDRSHLSRWEREYTCCDLKLCFVGRVRGLFEGSGARPDEAPVLLVSDRGQIFCYTGWREDAIHWIASDIEEFVRLGFRKLDLVYRSLGAVAPRSARAFQGVLRAWRCGANATSRYLIRQHGQTWPLSDRFGSKLRVCALRCAESVVVGGLLRRASVVLRSGAIPLGIVTCVDSSSPVPVFLTVTGEVFACDALARDYVRLADSLVAFVGLGLSKMRENCKFVHKSQRVRFERTPPCPCGAVE
uniref:Tegument protein UL24 n=1 Tax=Lemniscomys rat herpesvirus TaxID=3141920 RepID=A0AAU7E1J4_9VIRU